MTNKTLSYPILTLRDGDKNIYCTLGNFDIASVGGEKFYKKVNSVIDSDGKEYCLKSFKVKGNAKFIHWIRYFQKMIEIDLHFEDKVDKISLGQLKDRIFDQVTKDQKHWLVLDTLEGMKSRIYSAGSFEELIRIFK
jgi:hypothetical protein